MAKTKHSLKLTMNHLGQHYWLSHVYERAGITVGGLYEEGLTEHGPGKSEYSQQGPHTGLYKGVPDKMLTKDKDGSRRTK